MTTFTHEELAAWAERKRVRATSPTVEPIPRSAPAPVRTVAAQAVADHVRTCQDDER